MTGIFLVIVLLAWISVSVWVTLYCIRRFKRKGSRWIVGPALLATLVILPFGDEAIGAKQFVTLCNQNKGQTISPKAAKRRVVFVPRSGDTYATNTVVPIRIDPHVYRDAETGEVLVSYKTLHATGGWLIRTLGISETNAPLLFNGYCGPADQDGFKSRLNISVIN